MEAHNVKRLPVMSGDRLVGMVTHADFLPAVARLARGVESSAKDGSVRDDNRIRELIIAAVADQPWRPCAMNIDVQDGIVSLRGSVRSDRARRASVIAAENVPGVIRVEDELTIYPAPEEDYGGGDFVSLPEETSKADDQPL